MQYLEHRRILRAASCLAFGNQAASDTEGAPVLHGASWRVQGVLRSPPLRGRRGNGIACTFLGRTGARPMWSEAEIRLLAIERSEGGEPSKAKPPRHSLSFLPAALQEHVNVTS